jgi:transcriptional regulator with XRE-family HTH domain
MHHMQYARIIKRKYVVSPRRRHSLGRLIQEQRQARGLSQRALARATGLQNSTIMRLENGALERPDPLLLQRIARALDADLEDYYLLGDYPLPRGLPDLGVYMRTKYQLSDEEIAQVNKIIEEHITNEGGEAIERSNNTTT